MIFAASCRLNGSPGPSPGAPLKSPIVSRTVPSEPTDPAPVARLIRLKTLNISARSCNFIRSVMPMFLITDRSTSPNPGPWNAFRPKFPGPDAGVANAFGLTHCSPGSPPSDFEKLWETPANGLPTKSTPGRCVPALKLNGCPLWKDHRLLSCQPCVRIFGPCDDPGMSYVQKAVKLCRVSKSPLP